MYRFVILLVFLDLRTVNGVQKKPNQPWSVLVNGQRINTSQETHAEYDESGEYWYHEGELANVTCLKAEGMMNMTFPVFDSEDSRTTKATLLQAETYQVLHVILTKNYDNNYINCILTFAFLPQRETYIVRLYLKMLTNKAPPALSFLVNDMEMVPSWNQNNVFYTYEYISGEEVTIEPVEHGYEEEYACSNGTNLDVPELKKGHCKLPITTILRSKNSGQIIAFQNKKNKQTVHLVFKCICANNSYPSIFGLPQKGIMLKYNEKALAQSIQYRHKTPDNHLKLRCQTPTDNCNWTYYDKGEYRSKASENILDLNLQNVFNTTVQCKCPNNFKLEVESVVEIWNDASNHDTSLPGGPQDKKMKPELDHNMSSIVNNTKPIEDNIEGNKTGEEPVNWVVHGAIVVAALLVVALVIWMIVGVLKRKKKRDVAQESAINYETLPGHGEGTMSNPEQWDTYATAHDHQRIDDTYCDPHIEKNIDEMYAKPQPKSKRQPAPIESDYAEVGSESGYAEINLAGAKAPGYDYANVQNKKPLPGYGIIKPKLGLGPQVLPKPIEVTYAQAVPKVLRKPGDAETCYHNVFENQHYANATSNDKLTDYTEPTYCEPAYCAVNLKNK